jgi:hypothetical protein
MTAPPEITQAAVVAEAVDSARDTTQPAPEPEVYLGDSDYVDSDEA